LDLDKFVSKHREEGIVKESRNILNGWRTLGCVAGLPDGPTEWLAGWLACGVPWLFGWLGGRPGRRPAWLAGRPVVRPGWLPVLRPRCLPCDAGSRPAKITGPVSRPAATRLAG